MSTRSGCAVRRWAALPVVGLVLVAACGSDDAGSDDAAEAAQGAWIMEEGTADGEAIPIVEGSPITLVIEGDEVSGVSACNSYQTSVSIDGDSIDVGETAGTLMACEPDVMESEMLFLTAFGAVDTVSIEGDSMTLTGNEATLTLTRGA